MAISGSIIDQEGKSLIQATFAESKDLNSNFQVIEQHYDTSHTSLTLSDYNENTDKVLIFGSGLLKSPSTYTIDSSGKVTFSSNPSSSSFDIIIYRSLQTEVFQGNFGIEDLVNLKSFTFSTSSTYNDITECLIDRKDPSKVLILTNSSIGVPGTYNEGRPLLYIIDLNKKKAEALNYSFGDAFPFGLIYKEGYYYLSTWQPSSSTALGGFFKANNIKGPWVSLRPDKGAFIYKINRNTDDNQTVLPDIYESMYLCDGPDNYITCLLRNFGRTSEDYYNEGFIALGTPEDEWEIVFDTNSLLKNQALDSITYIGNNKYFITSGFSSGNTASKIGILTIGKNNSIWEVVSYNYITDPELCEKLATLGNVEINSSSTATKGDEYAYQVKRLQGNNIYLNIRLSRSYSFLMKTPITCETIEDIFKNSILIRSQNYYSKDAYQDNLPLKLKDDNIILVQEADSTITYDDMTPVLKFSEDDGNTWHQSSLSLLPFVRQNYSESVPIGKLGNFYSWDCCGPTFILGGKSADGEITIIYGIHEN